MSSDLPSAADARSQTRDKAARMKFDEQTKNDKACSEAIKQAITKGVFTTKCDANLSRPFISELQAKQFSVERCWQSDERIIVRWFAPKRCKKPN